MNWLAEFNRRWQAARGRRVTAPSRAFSLDWITLLEAAGVTGAEDQATAAREAEACGQLVLKRHRYRTYLIERVTLPLVSESRLIERFGGTTRGDLQVVALEIVAEFSEHGHARFPQKNGRRSASRNAWRFQKVVRCDRSAGSIPERCGVCSWW